MRATGIIFVILIAKTCRHSLVCRTQKSFIRRVSQPQSEQLCTKLAKLLITANRVDSKGANPSNQKNCVYETLQVDVT